MGQQQFLLIALFIVSIGAATIFALVAFENEQLESDRETALREAIEITLLIQTWKATSFREGGGAERAGFFGIDFAKLGLPHSPLSNREYRSDAGCFQIETHGDYYDAILIVTPSTCAGDPIAQATITGPYPEDVIWNFDW